MWHLRSIANFCYGNPISLFTVIRGTNEQMVYILTKTRLCCADILKKTKCLTLSRIPKLNMHPMEKHGFVAVINKVYSLQPLKL